MLLGKEMFMILILISRLLGIVFLICFHPHRAWPIHGWQRCLDCGKRRRFALGSPQTIRGVEWGRWEAPELPSGKSVRQRYGVGDDGRLELEPWPDSGDGVVRIR